MTEPDQGRFRINLDDGSWLFLLLVIAIASLVAAFGRDFTEAVITDTKDAEWWFGNFKDVILFPLVTAWFVARQQDAKETRRRQPYLGWRWHIIVSRDADGNITDEEFDDIFWADAQRMLESKFERWRAVKSILTTRGTVHTPTIEEARTRGWLIDAMAELADRSTKAGDGSLLAPADGYSRLLVIDISKMTKQFKTAKENPPPPGTDLTMVGTPLAESSGA